MTRSKSTTPYSSYFTEFGIQPLDDIIKTRRIKYLYYILTRNQNNMLYKFFVFQWNHSVKGDWAEQIRRDLKDFEIPCNLSWIQSQSKLQFTKYINKQWREYTFNYLTEKQSVQSKMKNLKYSKLEIQSYLMSGLSTEILRNVFLFRTRMSPFGKNSQITEKTFPVHFSVKRLMTVKIIFLCA